MTAPTTRETADHAELTRLAEAAKRVRRDSLGRLDGLDASRKWDDFIAAASPATVLALLSEVAALRVRAEKADALASKHFVALREKQDDAAILKPGKLEAERQRDELRKELEFIKGVVTPDQGSSMTDVERVIFARTSRTLANQGADQ